MSGFASELLGGRYRLVEPVGTGGMAVVWRARDEVLGRDVAAKLLAVDLATDPVSRDRIRAEAQAIARLQHPNITAVHDYGESAGDGTRYVIMELLEGQLLSARLRSGLMSWQRATQIAAQIAAALAAAHERGVVHRDIKPTNVMLTPAGVKVLDFGVAGLAGSPESDGDDTVFGTPAYLAPERLLGGVVVPATDVYALGVLLYRCLTDRLPWDADTPTQMLANHVYEAPAPLPLITGLPPRVIGLVNRCLAKDPEDRPRAEEAAQILAGATGIHVVLPHTDGVSTQEVRLPPQSGGGLGLGSGRGSGFGTGPVTRTAGVGRHAAPTRSGRPWLAAGAVLIAAAVGTSVYLTRDKPAATARPGCLITFYIQPRPAPGPDRGYAGRLLVMNAGTSVKNPWTVTFDLPGGQRMTATATTAQDGPHVTMTGTDPLPPGKAIVAGFTGTGGQPGAMPVGFALNGVSCQFAVDGDTAALPPLSGPTDPPPDVGSPRPTPFGPPPDGGPPPGGSPPPPPPGQAPTGYPRSPMKSNSIDQA